MRIPRDVSAIDLAKHLRLYGYELTRQTGSHIRLTTEVNGQHHVTLPNHDPIRIGTLSAILSEVAIHVGVSKDELVTTLFG